ncbi:MAG: hypothetical protein LBC92_04720 [Rickettsiales bacterium]|jgi:hypothetical protein|nr:hypothetical protein [Rickettsiales bacterium]
MYKSNAKQYEYSWNANLECGYYSNDALYASFGYETQIFTCKEATISFDVALHENWQFKGEFSPVYASIKNQQVRPDNIREYKEITAPNGDSSYAVDGGSKHIDWYKNIGNRPYNVGTDFPFKELYIKFYDSIIDDESYSITLGRQINKLSFDKSEVIWEEDMWFAPMSYWLSKDLYQGINFNFKKSLLNINFAVFSGDGNTTKDYLFYLQNEGNGNLKSNNTPTLSGSISIGNDYGKLFVGMERARMGSTYNFAIKEGKHTREIITIGGNLKLIQDFDMFGQYTIFKSGLNPSSAQNEPDVCVLEDNITQVNCFEVIKQKGFFVGIAYTYDKFKIGFTYEQFDRYDFNAFMYEKKFNEIPNPPVSPSECVGGGCFSNRTNLDKYKNAIQKSYIFQLSYNINNNVTLNMAYHILKNPLNWISYILPTDTEQKIKLSFTLKL